MPRPFDGTLIVMPALNEEEAVGNVVREVLSSYPGIACLVVDDGSMDATGAEASAAGAIVATLPFNLGVGGAMRVGFKYALEHGYRNVVQVDSDGQHDPVGLPALIEQLNSSDLVLGARFAGTGDYEVRGPRKWAMLMLSGILSRLARTRLTDTTSGFRASGPRAVRLFAAHYPAEYLGDTVESLVIASRASLRVSQVAVAMRPRAGGRPSHNPFKAAIYLGRAVMALFIALLRPPVILPSEASTR